MIRENKIYCRPHSVLSVDFNGASVKGRKTAALAVSVMLQPNNKQVIKFVC